MKGESAMVKAYVLIMAEQGKTESVCNGLAKMDDVIQFDAVMGEYDVIAVIQAPDVSALGKSVVSELTKIPGVRRCNSHLVVKF